MNDIRNYQKELDRFLIKLTEKNETPTLLLHSCCAPCASYVLEYLSEFFQITVFYYNPNIYPEEEYFHRIEEQKNYIDKLKTKFPVKFIAGEYDTKRFYDTVKGFEHEKEGGERCFKCYELRLDETAKLAKENCFDYFTTTLSISPYKSAQKLNEIGGKIAEKYNVKYLNSDFKKKNGYKRSIELSREHGLYRQDYCGCVFSKMETKD